MEYEVFLWEAKGKPGGPCSRPSLNETRLLKLCCWALSGTLAQRRLASMLLDDLDKAASIQREHVLEHDHAFHFWDAFERSFEDGPVSADAYMGRLYPNQKEFDPSFFAKAERLYGPFIYCGDVVGEYPGHAVAFGYLKNFAEKLSLLSRRENLKDADVVKQFEALTALGKAHKDFQAKGDPQRRAAIVSAPFRRRLAWAGTPPCAGQATARPVGDATESEGESNHGALVHDGAPAHAQRATARPVVDATDREGESSNADAEDIR